MRYLRLLAPLDPYSETEWDEEAEDWLPVSPHIGQVGFIYDPNNKELVHVTYLGSGYEKLVYLDVDRPTAYVLTDANTPDASLDLMARICEAYLEAGLRPLANLPCVIFVGTTLPDHYLEWTARQGGYEILSQYGDDVVSGQMERDVDDPGAIELAIFKMPLLRTPLKVSAYPDDNVQRYLIEALAEYLDEDEAWATDQGENLFVSLLQYYLLNRLESTVREEDGEGLWADVVVITERLEDLSRFSPNADDLIPPTLLQETQPFSQRGGREVKIVTEGLVESFRQVVQTGLDYGLIHPNRVHSGIELDLKPRNVGLDDEGRLVLFDAFLFSDQMSTKRPHTFATGYERLPPNFERLSIDRWVKLES
jgi:hypothetical protein